MSLTEITYVTIYFGMALVVVFAIVVAGGLALHNEERFRKPFVNLLPVILILAVAIGALISNRNVTFYGFSNVMADIESNYRTYWMFRLITLFVVFFSAVIVVSAVLKRQLLVPGAWVIALAFFSYFVGANVINGILGSEPSLSYKATYPLLLVLAAYVGSKCQYEMVVTYSRNALLLILLVGLVALFVSPQLVRQDSYTGLIPGIGFRYWGLASHANNIGPLSAFLLFLLYMKPFRRGYVNALAVTVASVSLILSQSRTAWLAFGLPFIILALRAAFIYMKQLFSRMEVRPLGAMFAFGLVAIPILGVFAVMMGWHLKPVDYLVDMMGHYEHHLTGRTKIWAITLDHWQENVLFGYGPDLWGPLFSSQYGYLGIASNAHNEFLSVLGSSGLVGVALFMPYYIILLYYGIKLRSYTRGVSIALVLFIVLRGLTEAPLKITNITTSDFFMHLFILSLFMRLAYAKAIIAR